VQGSVRNKNIDEAKKWYQIASEIGNTDSQIYLAQILEEEGDKTEAVNLYLKAAELKDYRAINYSCSTPYTCYKNLLQHTDRQ